MVNNHHSYEIKLEAIRLLSSGMSRRKICKKLDLKSDSLIYNSKTGSEIANAIVLNKILENNINYQKSILELP